MLSLTRVLDNYSTKKTEVKKFQIPHPILTQPTFSPVNNNNKKKKEKEKEKEKEKPTFKFFN